MNSKRYFLCTMTIFSRFFVSLTCIHREIQVLFHILSRMTTEQVSKHGKLDPEDRAEPYLKPYPG